MLKAAAKNFDFTGAKYCAAAAGISEDKKCLWHFYL